MSWLAAQQDFSAKILCDNINALAVHAASESLDPNICARYFINRGDAFSRITQIPRSRMWRRSDGGSRGSGDVRTSAQEGAKPRRTPSGVVRRAGEIPLA
ncbi:MAG: hypothetical protein V5B40_02130 [Candidatus Accumulibacter meliphilus]|uniref:hypothetical protein n=1 Tax=Candidatus Accumulibacter meliphilus TaxID=2211374 RepID=UPI002FC37DF9